MIFEKKDGEARTRTETQQIAMTAIYDALTYAYMGEPLDVEATLSGLTGEPYEEVDPFLKGTLLAAIRHLPEIVPLFERKMKDWKFQRLDKVEQAILVLAFVHISYVEKDAPRAAVIDNAVELAKKYLGAGDYRFVNAILDNVLPGKRKG